MLRFRGRTVAAAALVAAALVLTVKGQTPAPSFHIENIGLPAVEENAAIWSEARPGGRVDALKRAARETSTLNTRVGSSGRAYTPGRVIVRFRDEVPAAERRTVARLASDTAEMADRPSYADFDVVRIDANEDAEAVAAALAAQPQVVYAQPSYHVHASMVPNDPNYKTLQWNLPLVDIERAWDIQPDGASSVTVAVLDTGMAYRDATITVNIRGFRNAGVNYPALGPQVIPYSAAPQLVGVNGARAARIVAPFDVISSGANPPLDFEGHGTHVSGTIGQLTNDNIGEAGIAFNVKLMPVKVLGSFWDVIFGNALFEGGSDDDVSRGIHYAADNGAKVINMSLGSSGPPDCATNPNRDGCSPTIEAAIKYAIGKGAFVVVAGGNEFEDVDPDFGPNPTSVLAEIASRIKGAVSVAAVDPQKNRAFYSSTGSYIELAAPGGSNRGFGRDGFVFQQTFDFNFTDTFDPTVVPPSQYRAPRFDMLANIGIIGTSMATPHVSGIAAMLVQQGITDPAAIEEALEKSAVDIGTPGRDNSFGFGLVDARNALRGLGLSR
jgi:serine protease